MYSNFLNIYKLNFEQKNKSNQTPPADPEEERINLANVELIDRYFAKQEQSKAVYKILNCAFLNSEGGRQIKYFPHRLSSKMQVLIRKSRNPGANELSLERSEAVLLNDGRLAGNNPAGTERKLADTSWDFLIIRCFEDYYVLSTIPETEPKTDAGQRGSAKTGKSHLDRLFFRHKDQGHHDLYIPLDFVCLVRLLKTEALKDKKAARTISYADSGLTCEINAGGISVYCDSEVYYDLCRISLLVMIANTYNHKHGELLTTACEKFEKCRQNGFKQIDELTSVWEEYCAWYLNSYREFPIRYERVGRTFELWKKIAEYYNVAQAQKEIKDKIYEINEVCKYQNEKRREARFSSFSIVTTFILLLIGILQVLFIFVTPAELLSNVLLQAGLAGVLAICGCGSYLLFRR